MMNQHDDFYDKLPFTLQDNQTAPNYVIFGTGLQETLIAAYKSKMQLKPGLIIDTEKTYGSALKTLTFKEFHQLSSLKTKEKMYEFITPKVYEESNGQFFEDCLQSKKHRGYSIDIEPSIFLASSVTCQCLKQADMDKYMDFHLVKSILHIQKKKVWQVPLSKGKIFQSTELSLMEKKLLLSSLHKLMRIYKRYKKVEIDLNSTKQFDKDVIQIDDKEYQEFIDNIDNMFLDYISKMVKKNKKIIEFLAYIICNYQYNYQKPIPQHAIQSYTLKSFITKFGKFITSCGVYGQIPYLYVDNGIGDIPQAYSRIASIFASVYILHPKIEVSSITKDHQGRFSIQTNLSPHKPITTQQLFFGPTQLELRKDPEQFYEEKILRVFILAQKSGKEEQCPAICFINELNDFINPVYLFLFDNSSHSCPSDYIFYQFQSIIDQSEGQESCQAKGEKLLQLLESVYGEQFKKSIKYYSVYIRTRRYPKKSSAKSKEAGIGLNDTMGIDLDSHFQNFIEVVGQQPNYFKKEGGQQQDDQFYGEDAKYILQKMDELKITQQETPLSQEIVSKEKISQPQELAQKQENKEAFQIEQNKESKKLEQTQQSTPSEIIHKQDQQEPVQAQQPPKELPEESKQRQQ